MTTHKSTAAGTAPMDPQTRAALLRAARGQISASPRVPMGIRYRTPAAPARPVPADRRPLWMTLAGPTVLEEIAEATPRAAGPSRQRRRPAQQPPAEQAPRAAAATVRAGTHHIAPQPADEPADADRAGDTADGRVLRRFDGYACVSCGSRYGQNLPEHPCGPLTPITVTVTAGAAAPSSLQQVLGSYDAYACGSCHSRYGQHLPEHPCGPLTPVTVTVTVRAGIRRARIGGRR